MCGERVEVDSVYDLGNHRIGKRLYCNVCIEQILYDRCWLQACRKCGGCNYMKVDEDANATGYRCRDCGTYKLLYKCNFEGVV